MARPIKNGLDYFPLDVDFFADIKVRRIKKDCGSASISVLICLLCNIYRDGYYIRWNEDMTFAISESTGVAEGAVLEIVNKAVQVDFFDKSMLDTYKILTSKGIQNRFLNVIKLGNRKQTEIQKRFDLLVNSEETPVNSEETPVNSEETPVNSEESAQRKVKERKEKNTLSPQLAAGEFGGEDSFEKKGRGRKLFAPDHDAYKAAGYMAKKILKHTPNFPELRDNMREKTLQRWADDIDKITRLDGVSFDDFKKVLAFSQNDSFWQGKVLSGQKLRKNFGTLLVSCNSEGN